MCIIHIYTSLHHSIITKIKQSERLTWSLTPHSPAGAFAHKDSASPLLTLSEEIFGRQDLPLRRAMLTGLLPAYVDRFARAWHRLSTTDAFGLPVHYRRVILLRQEHPHYFFFMYVPSGIPWDYSPSHCEKPYRNNWNSKSRKPQQSY